MPELWTLLRVVVSLAVVLALAVVALRFALPRLMGMGTLGGGRGRRLEVLESAPLDRQHRVALVRVGGREYLLGVGAAGVTALDSWQAPSSEAAPATDAQAASGPSARQAARGAETAAPTLAGRLDEGARP